MREMDNKVTDRGANMRHRSSLRHFLIGLGMVAFGTACAVEPTALDLSVGVLSGIYQDRDLALQEQEQWLGVDAANWSGRRTGGPEISFSAAGSPIPLSGSIPDGAIAVSVLKDFVQSHKSAWGNFEGCDFIPLNAWEFRGIWHVALQQTYQGFPVFGSRVDGKLRKSGALLAFSARLFPGDEIGLTFALSQDAALRSLTTHPSAQIGFSRRVLYPVVNGPEVELRPAWQLRTVTDQPDWRPAGIVDAQTGEILLRYNDVPSDGVWGNVLGLVLPNYYYEAPQAWAQKRQWVNVVGHGQIYTDTLGNYAMNGLIGGSYSVQGKLQGLYVDVNNDDGPDAFFSGTAYTTSPLNWTWNYDLARQDEVNVYYHTTRVHDYFKSLDNDFTALDFPLPATVGYGNNYENAFWNGEGIFFGAGAYMFRNFALFSDVIYHEYGHGVTDMIYPEGMLPYTGQPGAMNEGWSDYFACSITGEPLIGEGGLQVSGQPLRNLDNTLRYPENWSGEVHADGRIFGGALWDLREMVGAGVADTLAHFARYAYAEMWEDYFLDVLILDDDDGDLSNGGPHHPAIYESFGLHGIGPGVEPELQIFPTVVVESQGNGDGFFDPGEVLSMTFWVTDYRYLYPPPAQDVTVTVTSSNPDLIFEPQTYSLGQIPAGATVPAPDSLLIQVSPQAQLSFAYVVFQVSANGGSYQIADSVEIIVGHPPTLLVDDDAGANYQMYLDNSLRQWGQVFCLYDVASQGPLPLDYLNQFQVAVWMTGNDSTSTLTTSDQDNLAAYLDGGHNLLLTGQNLVEDIGGTAFFADYLRASPLAGDVNDYALDGVPGDPISDSSWVLILGAGAAANQTSPGAIAALPGASEIYHYHNDPTRRPGAVRYDSGTFKTVTFAFGCEAISGLGGSWPQAKVLTSVLAWFGLPTAVEPDAKGSIPISFAVGRPFPNPFNAQISIPLMLPQRSHIRAELYNLAGQSLGLVFDSNLNAGAQTVRWDASKLVSGMYFLKIAVQAESGGEMLTQVSKMILLK